MAMDAAVPVLASSLKAAGFQTAAFVSAFPLDRRFGLQRGFDVYDDELPRSSDGRPQNERAGTETASRAIAWLRQQSPTARVFLWVHLFEPHAPYGNPQQAASRPVSARYDEEIAVADQQAGRLAFDGIGNAPKDVGVCETFNCGRGAWFNQVNVRVSKGFPLGSSRARIEAIGEVFNLFNSSNPSGFNPGGAATPRLLGTGAANPNFLQPTAFAGDFQQPEQRVGQIGFRFSF
jgi:hypothetical protein